MILNHPSVVHMDPIDREGVLRKIEQAAKTCYQSQCKENIEETAAFVQSLVSSGHWAPIELGGMFSVTIKTSRSVLAELTRHRMASFCVQSQRYSGKKISKYGLEFVIPTHLQGDLPEGYYEMGMVPVIGPAGQTGIGMVVQTAPINENGQLGLVQQLKPTEAQGVFLSSLVSAEQTYMTLLTQGWKPEDAREVLPNAKSVIVTMGANLREWKHIFDLRVDGTTGNPYPPCQQIMGMVKEKFSEALPEIFGEYKAPKIAESPTISTTSSGIILGQNLTATNSSSKKNGGIILS